MFSSKSMKQRCLKQEGGRGIKQFELQLESILMVYIEEYTEQGHRRVAIMMKSQL